MVSVHLSPSVDYRVPSRTMDARTRGEGSGRVLVDFSILNELCMSFLHYLGLTLSVWRTTGSLGNRLSSLGLPMSSSQ